MYKQDLLERLKRYTKLYIESDTLQTKCVDDGDLWYIIIEARNKLKGLIEELLTEETED